MATRAKAAMAMAARFKRRERRGRLGEMKWGLGFRRGSWGLPLIFPRDPVAAQRGTGSGSDGNGTAPWPVGGKGTGEGVETGERGGAAWAGPKGGEAGFCPQGVKLGCLLFFFFCFTFLFVFNLIG